MNIIETIIKKTLLVCLIPFYLILKLLSLFIFLLLSLIIYPINFFMINIRDIILGKNHFYLKIHIINIIKFL